MLGVGTRGSGFAPQVQNQSVFSTMHRPPTPSSVISLQPPAQAGLRPPGHVGAPQPPAARGESQGHADAVVLELAGQHPLVELVEVDELDQVGELGVPVVQAEEHLPLLLTLRDTRHSQVSASTGSLPPHCQATGSPFPEKSLGKPFKHLPP